MKKYLRKKGQGLVEWIMILACVLVFALVGLNAIGKAFNSKSSQIVGRIDTNGQNVSQSSGQGFGGTP